MQDLAPARGGQLPDGSRAYVAASGRLRCAEEFGRLGDREQLIALLGNAVVGRAQPPANSMAQSRRRPNGCGAAGSGRSWRVGLLAAGSYACVDLSAEVAVPPCPPGARLDSSKVVLSSCRWRHVALISNTYSIQGGVQCRLYQGL